MATKVTKITDEGNPGFGFFAVEGVPGYFTEETAGRVAKQMDDGDAARAAAAAAAAAAPPPPPEISDAASVRCPSCGTPFKVKALADAIDMNAALQAKIDAAAAVTPAPAPETPKP